MSIIPTLFASIIAGLRAAVAVYAVRDRVRQAELTLAWYRIGRAAARFAALFARWQSATLPLSRPSRAGRASTPRPRPYFPTGRAWLAGNRHEVCGFASQLNHFLARPDLADFLAAAPQAGRILRPLCHMLGLDPPEKLRLPQRPRRPRPRPATVPPASPPSPTGTPDRPIPANILRAARAWRKKSTWL